MRRHELPDAQWALVSELMPPDGSLGGRWRNHRNVVERCVGWLKHCRSLASRSDKLALNFPAWIKLAMIRQSLRRLCPSNTT